MNGCLSDIRVLELGQVLAAPYAGMILGDLGADVIKVEPPGGGDSARRTPPHFYKGESIYFMSLNRNKRSIVVDLKRQEGRRVFYDLASKSDVVLDNLRPGVLEQLKLNHEVLLEYNPRIISCSINGYGSDTPDAHKPAFDLMVQARGGGMSLTGEPGGPPLRMGVSISDHIAGTFATTGILAALHEVARTNRGRRVEVPLFSTMISMLSYEAAFHLYSGEVPGPVGSGHRSLIPYSAVETLDGYIVIDAHLPKFWGALCRALQIEVLENDPKFNTLTARNENRDELMEILNGIFPKKTSVEWLEVLQSRGVPCAPINNLGTALADEATRALKMVVDIEHKGIGLQFRAVGNPVRMPGSEDTHYSSPPLLGEHTGTVLREIAGYTDDEIRILIQNGVVTQRFES